MDFKMKAQDIQEVQAKDVVCDGAAGSLGHPRVYLTLDPHSHKVECPYCSKLFILKANSENHSQKHTA
jgi:uncharacterized Zn-finger protein